MVKMTEEIPGDEGPWVEKESGMRAGKVTLRKRTVYDVKVGAKTLRFARQSEWNGMIELRAADGQVLVVAPAQGSVFGDVFAEIFRDSGDLIEATVVSGSPAVLAEIFQPYAGVQRKSPA